MTLNKEEKQAVLTLLNAEIMKLNYHYGCNHAKVKLLYKIRDKILKEESDGRQDQN